MNEQILQINMFGSFSVKNGSESLTLTKNRESRMLHLLQYLIQNHGKGAATEKLVDVIYEGEEIDNPVKALQVLITRLRKALIEAGLPTREYILFSGGMYSWNTQIPCRIDTYEFEEVIKQARQPKQTPEQKIELYSRAVELYAGDFLPNLSGYSWAAVTSAYYSNLFLQAIEEAWEVLSEKGDYEGMLKLCAKGIEVCPSEERLHIIKITCLIKENRLKEAQTSYKAIVELLLNEWGAEPSAELQELYQIIAARKEGTRLPLNQIRDKLGEEKREGAFFCPYVSFTDSYHFTLRVLERSGHSAFLMLCNLVGTNGNTPEPGEKLTNAAESLSEAIRLSLRRGDLYTRYSSAQFLVLLIGTNMENCRPISNRIALNYRKLYKGRGIRLEHAVMSASQINLDKDTIGFSSGRSLWNKPQKKSVD